MKKKKLVIFFLALIPIYIIYNLYHHETLTYLSLGDDLAKGHTPFDTYKKSYADYVYEYLKDEKKYSHINKSFTEEDLRINDLLLNIKNNQIIDGKTLTQAIREANIITISVGSEELFSKIRSNEDLLNTNNDKIFNMIDNMINDYKKVIEEIRKLNKKPIYIIGLYNPINNDTSTQIKIDTIFNYLDIKYKSLEKYKNVYYVPIYEGFKEKQYYLPNKSNAFPSLEGYNYIANQIISKIKES